jgi:hypothetical protein
METIPKHTAIAYFEDWLDDILPTVKMFGSEYLASAVFREVDPTAYRCEFSIWVDAQQKDGQFIVEGYES